MKKLILTLAIMAMAAIAQEQTYTFPELLKPLKRHLLALMQ